MTEKEMRAINSTETSKFILTRAGYMLSVYLMIFGSAYAVSVIPYGVLVSIYIVMAFLCSLATVFWKQHVRDAVKREAEKFERHKLETLWFLKPLGDVILAIASMFIFSFNGMYWMNTFAQFFIFVTVIQYINIVVIYRIIRAN